MNKEAEVTSIGSAIEIARPQFEKITSKMPLSLKLNYEAEQRFAIQHLQNNTYLMTVARENPASLQAAMCNLAGIGLSLNPALKFAYLIPRNFKVGQNKWESRICAEPGYMGLAQLAINTGSIKWCQARLVYAKDKYAPAAPGNLPDHIYDPFPEGIEDRGEIKGVYCVAKTADGDYLTDEISITRINEIRDRTEIFKKAAKDNKPPSGPWVTDYAEQVLKTCVRHAYKLWPKTAQSEIMAQAVEISNENEGFEPLITSPEISQYTADQKGYLDQLIESNNAPGMAAFRNSVEEGVFQNLYHSFPKGEKGKYQKIIDNLVAKGMDELKGTADKIEQAAAKADDMGVKELIEELPEDEMGFVAGLLSDETAAFLREIE